MYTSCRKPIFYAAKKNPNKIPVLHHTSLHEEINEITLCYS